MRSIEIDDRSSWEPEYAPYFATLAPPDAWSGWLDPEDYSSADSNTSGGSEYLRVVADALGDGQRAPVEARGRPALIKCIVPNVELHPEVRRSCTSLPLRWKLTRRDPEAPPNFYVLDWGFMHPHPVPPDRISIEYLAAEA